MAYRPVEAKAKNLFSFESVEYTFPNETCAVQIVGENQFDKGQSRNGSGKSSLLEIFAICLKGQPVRAKASLKDCIRRGQEEASAYIKLQDGVDVLEIEWLLYPKKASKVSIIKNGTPLDVASVNDGKDLIQSILGVTSEDLDSYYIIGKAKFKPLLEMSDTAIKRTLGSFSNTDRVDNAIESVKEEAKTLNVVVQDLKATSSKHQGKIEAWSEMLEEKENNPPTSSSASIDNSKEIEALKVEGKKVYKSMKVAKKQLEALVEPTGKYMVNHDTHLSIDELKEKLEKLEATEQRGRVLKSKYAIALEGEVTCPSCDFEFSPDAEIAAKFSEAGSLRKEIEVVDKKLEILEGRQNKLKETIAKLSEESANYISQRSELRSSVKASKSEVDNIKRKIDSLEFAEEASQSQENPREAWQEEMRTLRKNIADKQSEDEALTQEIKNHQAHIDRSDVSIGVLNKFKTVLLNKCLMVIEGLVNDTLANMDCGMVVQLEGFKQLKNGDVRAEVGCSIIRESTQDVISYGSLSGGERSRLDLAFIIAIQSMKNKAKDTGGLNMLFLDEILESVEAEGIDLMLKSLNKTNVPILLISQNSGMSNYPHTLKVVKGEDGISKIEQDGEVL